MVHYTFETAEACNKDCEGLIITAKTCCILFRRLPLLKSRGPGSQGPWKKLLFRSASLWKPPPLWWSSALRMLCACRRRRVRVLCFSRSVHLLPFHLFLHLVSSCFFPSCLRDASSLLRTPRISQDVSCPHHGNWLQFQDPVS